MKAGKPPRNDTTRRINQANEFYDKKIQRAKQKNDEMLQKLKYLEFLSKDLDCGRILRPEESVVISGIIDELEN